MWCAGASHSVQLYTVGGSGSVCLWHARIGHNTLYRLIYMTLYVAITLSCMHVVFPIKCMYYHAQCHAMLPTQAQTSFIIIWSIHSTKTWYRLRSPPTVGLLQCHVVHNVVYTRVYTSVTPVLYSGFCRDETPFSSPPLPP